MTELIGPWFLSIFNSSLSLGCVPDCFKTTCVQPFLKAWALLFPSWRRAHVRAATQCSRHRYLISLLIVFLLLKTTYVQAYVKYSRHELLVIGSVPGSCILNQDDPRHNIPSELVRPPGSQWINLKATEAAQREEAEARLSSRDTS